MPSIPIFLKCGRFSPIPTSRLGKAGKQVRLSVQDLKGQTRDAIVTPISNRQEFNLRYHEWEYTRLQEVDTMSDGTIGNVNLRAMGHDDIGQWTRKFYPQTA
jgi:tricorn protease